MFIPYISYFCENIILVKAIIDIPNDIFTYLSVKAKASGMNLKKCIEDFFVPSGEA